MERYTSDFVEDFDLNPETTLKYRMWAAYASIEDGMDESDVLLIYQITYEELRKYYQENPVINKKASQI